MFPVQSHFSTAQIAELLDVKPWRVRRLFDRNILPDPPQVAGVRLVPRVMLPAIIDALRERGWMPATEVVCTTVDEIAGASK